MKTARQIGVIVCMLLYATAAGAEGEEGTIKVQAVSGDPDIVPYACELGADCAVCLQESLSSEHKFGILTADSVNGPPGVLYMLQNQRMEIIMIKCGLHGAGCGGSHE
jgi:hypothetical protein